MIIIEIVDVLDGLVIADPDSSNTSAESTAPEVNVYSEGGDTSDPLIVEATNEWVMGTEIVDLNGQTWASDTRAYQKARIHIQPLPPGLYVLWLHTSQGWISQKFWR